MYLIFFALIALFQGSASADTITLATSPKYYLRLGYPTELEAQQSFQIANANISSVKIHLSRRGNVTMPVTISIRSTRTGPDLVATTISPTGLSTDYKNPTPITVLFNPTFVGAGERWVNVKTTIGSSSTYYQLVIGEYRAPLPGKLYQRNNVVSNRALMATIDFSTGAPPPPPPAQCGDGLDNDGDGKIDFGSSESNDPGCSSLTDNDETEDGASTASAATVFSSRVWVCNNRRRVCYLRGLYGDFACR